MLRRVILYQKPAGHPLLATHLPQPSQVSSQILEAAILIAGFEENAEEMPGDRMLDSLI